jgi:hypothetical protein
MGKSKQMALPLEESPQPPTPLPQVTAEVVERMADLLLQMAIGAVREPAVQEVDDEVPA